MDVITDQTSLGLQTVVVGVDDGPASRAALSLAATLTADSNATLVAVHVYRAGHGGPSTPQITFADPALSARQTLNLALEEAADRLAAVDVVPTLIRGHVVNALIERSHGADLIVVGRPDRYRHAPEWAVATQVALRARCPVILVPSGWQPTSESAPVTVAVDVPRYGSVLVDQGFRMAHARDLPVRVLHLGPSGVDLGRSPGTAGSIARMLREEMRCASAAYPDVVSTLEIRGGAPGAALEETSRNSSMIVVGRHSEPHRIGRRLGNVARHVLRTSACPVLLLDLRECLERRPRGSTAQVGERADRRD